MYRSRLTRCDDMYLEESQLYAAGRQHLSLPPEIVNEFGNRLNQLCLHRLNKDLGETAARHAQCIRTSVARLMVGLSLLAIVVPLLALRASTWIVHYLQLESNLWELSAIGAGVAIATVVIIRVNFSVHANSERVIQSLMVVAYRMRDLDRRIDAANASR